MMMLLHIGFIFQFLIVEIGRGGESGFLFFGVCSA